LGRQNFGFFAVFKNVTRWPPGTRDFAPSTCSITTFASNGPSPSASDFARSMPITKFVKPFHNPPEETRAYFVQCVARYPNEIVRRIGFSRLRSGEGPLQRVPMLDPLRGTRFSPKSC